MALLETSSVRMSEVISALSHALDITEGQPKGHALRSCLIGMRLAEEIGVPVADRSALFYSLLLKDAGCSSNAAKVCSLFRSDDQRLKQTMKTTDWTSFGANFVWALRNVAPSGSPLERAAALLRLGLEQGKTVDLFLTRCERGADIAQMIGLPEATAAAIRTLDEHWDGKGEPHGVAGDEIPLLGRIVCLAQTVDVFAETHGVPAAESIARKRSGTWFDPKLVAALPAADSEFWLSLAPDGLADRVAEVEPVETLLLLDAAGLDRVAEAFARVIDAKSPFTARHSERVAELSVAIGAALGLEAEPLRRLRRAALLHDIGKLGVSNLILDKPGVLDGRERQAVELHPAHTREILARVGAFRELAADAAAHHEKLDGSGYPLGLQRDEVSETARILAVADVYEAMTAERPYRGPMPAAHALRLLSEDVGLDQRVVAGLAELVSLSVL